MIDHDECGAVRGMRIGKGKPKYSKKTCPSATLSTTNLTWHDLGSNKGRRGGKPANNCLRYGTACQLLYWVITTHKINRQKQPFLLSWLMAFLYALILCAPIHTWLQLRIKELITFNITINMATTLAARSKHEPCSPARTTGSWVRISFETWMSVCVYSVFVFFCV
jgi:hypothetical protein